MTIGPEDKDTIRTLYYENKSLSEIGDALGGVSKQTVWYHVKKMSLERDKPDLRKKIHEERRQKAAAILEDLDGSITINELKDRLDCSWGTAKSIMQELGKYEKPEPFIERVDEDRLIHRYVVEDLSLSDLQEVYSDVSEMTISKTLKDLGVPMRPQGASMGKIRKEWRKKAMVKLGLTNMTW